ncbi:hypothetical protein [Variovorax gossypii]|jgi:hypothetical protein|uniref:hypothetical protein n=1 Tax=uncultured Variovorax sp. TaxID=114708 RepID=UPI0026329203|nr:hypothetical protein [uncultured Variovorax sp.]
MIDDPHDFLDIKIRLVRGESPILFKALEGIESRPGSRTRTLYFRQLAEMGLMVQEERMRRDPGVSTRTASALVRDLTTSASAVQAAPAPTPSAPALVAQAPASAAPAPTPSPSMPAAPPATVQSPAVPAPVAHGAQDSDRPAPRTAGQGGARRLLEGEDYA